MSFEYCINQLATVIKTISGYGDTNVSSGDYRILQKGITKGVVLRPGAFSRERSQFKGGIDTNWDITTELFIKYQNDSQINNDIRDERQNIIDKVDQYPFLNTAGTSTIYHAKIVSGNDPVPVFSEDGSGPHYFMQEMRCLAEEHVTVTELE